MDLCGTIIHIIHFQCLLYVENPSSEIQWCVLEKDPYNLQFVRDPTPQMIKSCIQRAGPSVLRYLHKDTEAIREAVREYNPRLEEFVHANPVIPILPISSAKKIVIRGGAKNNQFKSIR